MGWRGPNYPGEVPTLGWYVLDWMQENLTVPQGIMRGEPFVPTPEQARFILRLYSVDPAWNSPLIRGNAFHNPRLTRRAVISRGKGWGKSPFLAAILIAECLADVVPDGWDANGELVGRPWKSLGISPEGQICAVSEDQTNNTWRPLWAMATEGPVVSNYAIEPMKTFIAVPGAGKTSGYIARATSAGRSREGATPVMYVMDQTESWFHSNGGHDLAEVCRRNLSKLQGLSIESPNGFVPGEDSVAERSFEAYRKQREGKLRGEDGIYYDHREMPADVNTEDREDLKRGLAIAYGDSADVNGGWVNLDRKVEEYWDPDTDPMDAARYYANQLTAAADSWLSQTEWRARMDLEKMVDETEPITLGFDGSRKRSKGVTDATALIGCRVSDGHLFQIAVWEQPDGPSGRDWEVPKVEVVAAVEEVFRKYNVVGFYADPHLWDETIAIWEAKYGDRLQAKATLKSPIAWPMNGARLTDSVRALAQMHAAIINGEMTHDGAFAMTRHFLNARRRVVTNVAGGGILIAKEHPLSARKIDAAIAATLAYRARIDALSAGVTTTKKKSNAVGGWW